MLMFIAITFGVMLGILLAGFVTCIVMLNPTFVRWITNKYVNAIENMLKNYEDKYSA